MSNLASYFPNWKTTGGLFSTLTGMPWDDVIDGKVLDIMYFGGYSGIKLPTQFVSAFSTNGVADGSLIASYISQIKISNWIRLWNAFVSEYQPLDTFSITEHKVVDEDGSNNRTKNLHITDTGTLELEHGLTVDTDSTTNNSRSGFNSQTNVPVNDTVIDATQTNTGTDTTRQNLLHTDGGTDNVVTANDIVVDSTRIGNMGYHTPQQILKQEFDLWGWNFFEKIFDDFDEYLTLSVFDACQKL